MLSEGEEDIDVLKWEGYVHGVGMTKADLENTLGATTKTGNKHLWRP